MRQEKLSSTTAALPQIRARALATLKAHARRKREPNGHTSKPEDHTPTRQLCGSNGKAGSQKPCKGSNKRSKRNRKEHNVYMQINTQVNTQSQYNTKTLQEVLKKSGRREGERVGKRRKAAGEDDVGRRTDLEGRTETRQGRARTRGNTRWRDETRTSTHPTTTHEPRAHWQVHHAIVLPTLQHIRSTP